MWRAIQWLISYILGGLSFTFILVGCVVVYVWTYGSTPIGDPDPWKSWKGKVEHDALQAEMETGRPNDPDAALDGWLTIRRSYDRLGEGINPLIPPPLEETGIDEKGQKTYSSRIAQTYRSITGNNKKNEAPKDYFWCSLKGPVFYVHRLKDDRVAEWEEIKKRLITRDEDARRPTKEMLETVVVLNLNRYEVTMEGKEGEVITEGKLFGKRNAIGMRLVESEKGKKDGLPHLAKGMTWDNGAFEDEGGLWYIFCKSNFKAEDWYLSMLKHSHARPSTSQVWSEEHMSWFKDKMHLEDKEDKSGLEWLNAIVGRIFLGITHTALVEQFIIDKLNKKLALVSHPLIGPLVATEVNLGHIPPTFSNAMLKQCSADGEVRFHAHLDYSQPKHIEGSSIRITIEATKLGFRAVLAVIVKAISGDVEVRIKGPPSDRIWWAFLTPPKMDISIEPILGSRTINWNVVLGFIEKKMREGINDSVVMPYMDDTPFFDTVGMIPRGGIFNSASKRAYAQERQERKEREALDDSDSKSIDSKSIRSIDSKSDKDKVEKIERKLDKPFDSHSVTSVKTEGAGMRKRNNRGAIPEEELLETHAVQRSETTPNLQGPKKPSSLRMFGSRPASPRKRSSESSTDQLKAPSSKPETPTPTHLHENSVSIDDDKAPLSPESIASHEPQDVISQHRVTTHSVLTAVRARDKVALQSQVVVGRDAVKKWGVNFMNKRREQQEAGHHQEQQTPSSYYAPSPEDAQVPQPPVQQPRTSLQERLNAAALAAAAKREHERQASGDAKSSAQPIPAKPRSDSAGSATLSPVRAMVVPSIPKRPGVPTSIGNDSAENKSSPAPPTESAPVTPVVHKGALNAATPISRVESDPLASKPAERAEEVGEGDKAATPIPLITPANVTTRMRQASSASNSSPARESLLAAAASESGPSSPVSSSSKRP